MRVLVITNDYPPKAGGIQQYVGRIVAGYDGPVRVLGPAHRGAPDDPGVVRSKWRFMWPTPRVRRWIAAEIERFQPDVLFFAAPHPLAQLGPALRRSTGLPYVVLAHGAEVTVPFVVPGLRQIVASTLRRADVVFAGSHFTARRVARATGREVDYLGYGVDTDAFRPAEAEGAEPWVVGISGRFIPRKGHVRVFRAVARLRGDGHPIEVLVVGRGRLEGRLRRQAARLGIPARFEIDVPFDQLPELYRQMDVFASPTRSRWFGLEVEGFGIVFIEAAATGIPVLAGPSGGAPESVVPGESGYIVSTANEVAAGILEALGRRAELGSAGRARVVADFTWEAVMDRFADGLTRATT